MQDVKIENGTEVGSGCQIGDGTIIMRNIYIRPNTEIESQAYIPEGKIIRKPSFIPNPSLDERSFLDWISGGYVSAIWPTTQLRLYFFTTDNIVSPVVKIRRQLLCQEFRLLLSQSSVVYQQNALRNCWYSELLSSTLTWFAACKTRAQQHETLLCKSQMRLVLNSAIILPLCPYKGNICVPSSWPQPICGELLAPNLVSCTECEGDVLLQLGLVVHSLHDFVDDSSLSLKWVCFAMTGPTAAFGNIDYFHELNLMFRECAFDPQTSAIQMLRAHTLREWSKAVAQSTPSVSLHVQHLSVCLLCMIALVGLSNCRLLIYIKRRGLSPLALHLSEALAYLHAHLAQIWPMLLWILRQQKIAHPLHRFKTYRHSWNQEWVQKVIP